MKWRVFCSLPRAKERRVFKLFCGIAITSKCDKTLIEMLIEKCQQRMHHLNVNCGRSISLWKIRKINKTKRINRSTRDPLKSFRWIMEMICELITELCYENLLLLKLSWMILPFSLLHSCAFGLHRFFFFLHLLTVHPLKYSKIGDIESREWDKMLSNQTKSKGKIGSEKWNALNENNG